MPILHIQINAQGKAPDGTAVPIPPSQAMSARGPVLQVSVTIISSVAEQVIQQGATLPSPISGLALIDTGATTTCIDDEIAQQIGAPVIDVVKMNSASHANTDANIYPVHLEIAGFNIHINAQRCMGAALQPHGLIMLIGRDVLAKCTLFYNGVSGQFTLSI